MVLVINGRKSLKKNLKNVLEFSIEKNFCLSSVHKQCVLCSLEDRVNFPD